MLAVGLPPSARGQKHADVAVTLSLLAVNYAILRRILEAEQRFKQALAMYEELYGRDHPDLLDVLEIYAGCYAR